MMGIALIVVGLLLIWSLLTIFVIPFVKYYIFGYKRYHLEKLGSIGGSYEKEIWAKKDEDVLEGRWGNWADFIDITYPTKHAKRIRPKRDE